MTWKELAQDYSNVCAQIGHIVVEISSLCAKNISDETRMINEDEKLYLQLYKKKIKLVEDAAILLEVLRSRK